MLPEDYKPPFAFTGTVKKALLDRRGRPWTWKPKCACTSRGSEDARHRRDGYKQKGIIR
jgi:hypothetical protein